MRVLFVCSGNICRSPMAEAMLRNLAEADGLADQFFAESAGVSAFDGDAATPQSIDVMKWRDIDLTPHRSRRLTRPMLDGADIVVCMTEGHRAAIEGTTTTGSGKVFLLKELGEAARNLGMSELDELLAVARIVRDSDYGSESGEYEVRDPYGGSQGEYDVTAQTLEVQIGDLWGAIRTTRGEPGN